MSKRNVGKNSRKIKELLKQNMKGFVIKSKKTGREYDMPEKTRT
jgi:hypothetical protein